MLLPDQELRMDVKRAPGGASNINRRVEDMIANNVNNLNNVNRRLEIMIVNNVNNVKRGVDWMI